MTVQVKRFSRVDRVLADLATPHVVDGDRLAELDVVVRSEIEPGIRHQIGPGPQVSGDLLPAAGPALGSTVRIDARQVVGIDERIAPTEAEQRAVLGEGVT